MAVSCAHQGVNGLSSARARVPQARLGGCALLTVPALLELKYVRYVHGCAGRVDEHQLEPLRHMRLYAVSIETRVFQKTAANDNHGRVSEWETHTRVG